MSPEVALLAEVWQVVKSHINTKEQLDVAEDILKAFDEHVGLDDIDLYKNEFDRAIKAAIVSYYGEPEDDDDFEDEWS